MIFPTFSVLFEPPPSQWGLRGDPYLWQEMRDVLKNQALPEDEKELRRLLETTYEEITGASINDSRLIFIERFNHGGMSGGGISPKFWAEQAIPLLLERFRLLQW